MTIKADDKFYELLERKYVKEFIKNMQDLTTSFFDRGGVPWALRCTSCNGTGNVGRNVSRTCRICQGKCVAPIPSCEVLPSETLKFENSFEGSFSNPKK